MSRVVRIDTDDYFRGSYYRWEEGVGDFEKEVKKRGGKILAKTVYASVVEAIKDDETYKNDHYSDGECLDWVLTILHDLGLDEDF